MIEKFKMKYLSGGYVRILWQDIIIAEGRPWIKDPKTEGYSAMVQHLWGKEEYYDCIPYVDTGVIDG